MKRCESCHVNLADGETKCPLCRRPADTSEGLSPPMYPQIDFNVQGYKLLINIFKVIALILALSLILINYLYFHGIWWSLITVGAMAYAYITLYYSIFNNANPAAKILVQTLAAQFLFVWIDYLLGYRGWSFNYAVPLAIIIANSSMFILMLVNFMNWQSYLLFQIEYVIFSLIPIVLYEVGVITRPLFSMLALISSLLILTGTMMFGDKEAKDELRRRFHF